MSLGTAKSERENEVESAQPVAWGGTRKGVIVIDDLFTVEYNNIQHKPCMPFSLTNKLSTSRICLVSHDQRGPLKAVEKENKDKMIPLKFAHADGQCWVRYISL